MDILKKIDNLRKERGWSINYLAMEAMLTQSTLNNLYTRNTEPKISTLRAICDAFGITLSEFFNEDDPLENEKKIDEQLAKKNLQIIIFTKTITAKFTMLFIIFQHKNTFPVF